jgi:hypothetical protein
MKNVFFPLHILVITILLLHLSTLLATGLRGVFSSCLLYFSSTLIVKQKIYFLVFLLWSFQKVRFWQIAICCGWYPHSRVFSLNLVNIFSGASWILHSWLAGKHSWPMRNPLSSSVSMSVRVHLSNLWYFGRIFDTAAPLAPTYLNTNNYNVLRALHRLSSNLVAVVFIWSVHAVIYTITLPPLNVIKQWL